MDKDVDRLAMLVWRTVRAALPRLPCDVEWFQLTDEEREVVHGLVCAVLRATLDCAKADGSDGSK